VKEETKEWVDRTEEDLFAAQVPFDRDLRGPAVFHCHLAVEKILKAHWIEQQEGVPPRTHDPMELLQELDLDLPAWHEYLADLSRQAVASRYAGSRAYSRERMSEYLEKAKELCELLQQELR